MDENEDPCLLILPEDLPAVLNEFFEGFGSNPLIYVPMEEAVSLWEKDFVLNEDGEYQVNENSMKEFLDKINKIQCDRVFSILIKEGKATLGFDGTDFCLIPIKKT